MLIRMDWSICRPVFSISGISYHRLIMLRVLLRSSTQVTRLLLFLSYDLYTPELVAFCLHFLLSSQTVISQCLYRQEYTFLKPWPTVADGLSLLRCSYFLLTLRGWSMLATWSSWVSDEVRGWDVEVGCWQGRRCVVENRSPSRNLLNLTWGRISYRTMPTHFHLKKREVNRCKYQWKIEELSIFCI